MSHNSWETGPEAMPPSDPRVSSRSPEAFEVTYDLPQDPSLDDVAALHDVGCEHQSLFRHIGAHHDLIRAKDALELALETFYQLPVTEQISHAGNYWGTAVQRTLHEVRNELAACVAWDAEA